VAIDGPAGSGKSTIARLLAQRLEYNYIDTGALYRALTLKAIRQGIDLDDEDALTGLAEETRLDIEDNGSDGMKVMLDNEDVTHLIRTPELTSNVSYVAKVSGVREKMLRCQHGIGGRGRCVFEGRDIGTVVFPDARYKFYLDAEFAERVSRRYKELKQEGVDSSYEEVARDLRIRDHKDMSRDVAPLKKAEGAHYIDTTNMSISESVEKLADFIKE